jgi:hypothetical protein
MSGVEKVSMDHTYKHGLTGGIPRTIVGRMQGPPPKTTQGRTWAKVNETHKHPGRTYHGIILN